MAELDPASFLEPRFLVRDVYVHCFYVYFNSQFAYACLANSRLPRLCPGHDIVQSTLPLLLKAIQLIPVFVWHGDHRERCAATNRQATTAKTILYFLRRRQRAPSQHPPPRVALSHMQRPQRPPGNEEQASPTPRRTQRSQGIVRIAPSSWARPTLVYLYCSCLRALSKRSADTDHQTSGVSGLLSVSAHWYIRRTARIYLPAKNEGACS